MPFKSEKQRRFLHAKHPAIAKRWEKEKKAMPVKRSSKPKTTIGRGKKGTLKRAIYKTGGGRKTLKSARSLGQGGRKAVAKSKTATSDVRKIRTARMRQGRNATTGQKTSNAKVRIKQAKVLAKQRKKG